MRVLLDTSVWLFMLSEPEKLNKKSQKLLIDPESEIYLSPVSSWEIAIKTSIGNLIFKEKIEEYIPRLILENGIKTISINHLHALRVTSLPKHHKDPFDRLLIAQSQLEQIPILTTDRIFKLYDVEIIQAD